MKKSLSLLISFCSVFAFVGFLPTSARAETQFRYASPEGTYAGDCSISAPCSIQRAVDLSNSAGAGVQTTIYLKSGTYVADTSQWYPEVIHITNSVKIIGRCDFSTGSPVCSPENAPSILYGETHRRIIKLQLADPEIIHLFNLTLDSGNGTEQSPTECPDEGVGDPVGCGGAIFATVGAFGQNELKIENCVFQSNYGRVNEYGTTGEQGLGGAISLSNFGVLKIDNSTFDHNVAILDGYGYGGAIRNSGGQTIIKNTSFLGNRCTFYAKIGAGCAVQIKNEDGLTEISDSKFVFNNHDTTPAEDKRRPGSAIYLSSNDQVKIAGNILTENNGESALFVRFPLASSSNLITQNQFHANFTDYAVDLQYAAAGTSPANMDFFHNFVGYQWGYDEDGVETRGVRVQSDISTNRLRVNFWHNSLACLDLGVYMVDFVDVDFINNIIAHAYEAARAYKHYPPSGPEITGHTNLTYFSNIVDLPDTDLVNADPKFVNLFTGDLHLKPNSPAIDRAANLGLVTDIDGEQRPFGDPDIGADEYMAWQFLPHLLK